MAHSDGRGRRGEAGPTGDDVRSDLHAGVELTGSGGLRIEVRSKVASMYGESIRATAESVLRALGVENARVEIDDGGALPFTIAARVEAAARRAGVHGRGDARPRRTVPRGEPTAADRLRRSRLYLPGNQPKLFINAGLYHADAVILDLEDSVHPDEKDGARLLVRNALRTVDFMGAERMVRINQLPLGLEDLEAIVPEGPDLILIPKVEHAGQVAAVGERINDIGGPAGDGRPIWLMPILESALGIENAFATAVSSETVVALTIGLEDYTADMGVPRTQEGGESLWARADGLREWAMRSRALGFEGMGCIHPRQIPLIHEAFAPSAVEVERALAIVAAFDEARAQGLGVVRLGTRMIDAPVVLRAQRLVANARRMGVIPQGEAG
jgi:citrate lyase subunit beta/citryl-CoA lyase